MTATTNDLIGTTVTVDGVTFGASTTRGVLADYLRDRGRDAIADAIQSGKALWMAYRGAYSREIGITTALPTFRLNRGPRGGKRKGGTWSHEGCGYLCPPQMIGAVAVRVIDESVWFGFRVDRVADGDVVAYLLDGRAVRYVTWTVMTTRGYRPDYTGPRDATPYPSERSGYVVDGDDTRHDTLTRAIRTAVGLWS